MKALTPISACGDGHFVAAENGVQRIEATADGKVELIHFENKTLAYVTSSTGYPAYYPLLPAKIEKPIKAVLMDLDGTSVHSEEFWIWIIEQTTATLLHDPTFTLLPEDTPFVSGHSVSEHLHYCITRYCPDQTLPVARTTYMNIARREMKAILEGCGKQGAFVPTPGLKPFLLSLKETGIKIGLVTSGLHEKAWPEIVSAFESLDLGYPEDFYDAIITAGELPGSKKPGTLGDLEAKPHPWLYAEAAIVGLGLSFSDRNNIVGIEDSAAGICSVRLAGFPAIGLAGGNIIDGGAHSLCTHFCNTLEEIRTHLL